MARKIVVTGAIWLLLTGTAAAQLAPDCGRAATPVDKAVCTDPKLAGADNAMAQAYAALRAALPADRHAALLADQRDWLRQRDAGCKAKAGSELAECLLTHTEQRRDFLAGKNSAAGPGAPRLLPDFFREERKGRYKITIEYPQIADASNPAAAVFNKAMHDTALPKDLADFRTLEPGLGGGENWYEASYTVTYLDRRLAAIVLGVFSYGGGAHPNTGRTGVLFDLEQARPVTIADILAEPKPAIEAIAALCKTQLETEAKKEDWELFDNADIGAVVGDIATWSVDKDGVDIMFDPYSVAAYVAGPHECRLSYAELAQWLKPGGPLPPHQKETK